MPNFIVAMTAHAMKGDEVKFSDAGMDEYIFKPVRVARLMEVLAFVSSHLPKVSNVHVEQGWKSKTTFSERLALMGDEDREDILSVVSIFSDSVLKDISDLKQALEDADFAQIGLNIMTQLLF